MDSILVNAICYNNFSDIKPFVEAFTSYSCDYYNININIINNGKEIPNDILCYLNEIENLKVISGHGNVGYFPGAKLGLNIEKTQYNHMIVCNMDLTISEDFFKEFSLVNITGIIAPQIYSSFEKKDRNPKIVARYNKKQIRKFEFLYAVPYFHFFYKNSVYKLKGLIKSKKSRKTTSCDIYAPHGSFIVFSNNNQFWDEYLSYPIFLFGEEIFIGEIAMKNKDRVTYLPSMKVYDRDHGSTGLESETFIRKNNLFAIQYLKDRFWS